MERVVSVTQRPRFSPGERNPGIHCTGGWVGPKAGLDTESRRKILSPLPGIEPRSYSRPARSQTLYWLSYPAHIFGMQSSLFFPNRLLSSFYNFRSFFNSDCSHLVYSSLYLLNLSSRCYAATAKDLRKHNSAHFSLLFSHFQCPGFYTVVKAGTATVKILLYITERRGRMVNTLALCSGSLGSNLGLETDYPDWDFSWSSSVPPGKRRDSTSN
jgi:hypothetical protein